MMEKEMKNIALMYKALSDDKRLTVLESLKNGEVCANDLLEKLKISQSTLSHHMKVLTESKIVIGRREGKWMYYSLNKEGIMLMQRNLLSYALA